MYIPHEYDVDTEQEDDLVALPLLRRQGQRRYFPLRKRSQNAPGTALSMSSRTLPGEGLSHSTQSSMARRFPHNPRIDDDPANGKTLRGVIATGDKAINPRMTVDRPPIWGTEYVVYPLDIYSKDVREWEANCTQAQ